jgi:hypothetical protein
MTNTIDYPTLINNIIAAITRYSEEASDGECLDEVWGLLEAAGYAEALRTSRDAAETKYLAAAEENRVAPC